MHNSEIQIAKKHLEEAQSQLEILAYAVTTEKLERLILALSLNVGFAKKILDNLNNVEGLPNDK